MSKRDVPHWTADEFDAAMQDLRDGYRLSDSALYRVFIILRTGLSERYTDERQEVAAAAELRHAGIKRTVPGVLAALGAYRAVQRFWAESLAEGGAL